MDNPTHPASDAQHHPPSSSRAGPLRILYVERDPAVVDLAVRELRKAGLEAQVDVVSTLADFTEKLHARPYDVVLANFQLPGWEATQALRVLQRTPQTSGIPFVFVTAALGEETAVECIREGAADYVLKDQMARLPVAIRRALQEKAQREAHRLAEEALREGETRLRTIIETEPECVKVLSPDAVILEMNAAGLAMIEADDPAQVIGHSCMSIIAEEHRAAYRALLEQVLRGGRGALEFEIVGLRGTRRWLETHAAPLPKSYGFPMCMLTVTRDVSERKRTEQALRDSELRYRTLFERNLAGVFRSTIAGRLVDCNDAFASIFGYSRDQMLALPAHDFYFHPSERDEFINLLFERGSLSNFELRMRRADGCPVWVLENVSVLSGPDGSPAFIEGTLIDITERNKAEEQLRFQAAALESAANEIIITDPDGKILWVNPAFTRQTGYSITAVVGQNPRILKSGIHPPSFYEKMWKAIRNAQVWSGEITNRRKDGSLFTEEMTITPVRNAAGRISHFVAIKQDITERKRSELMLAGEKRVLEKIARGDSLLDILEALTRGAEVIVPGLLGSFLLLDTDGVRLRHAVAPNLPPAYTRAIDGLRIGPAAGSCGTAAFRKQPVIVEDTLADPLWADFRELARKYGLRACWSTPILSSKGEVLGTFALYHPEPRRPAPYEWQAIERVGYLAGIAINRSRAEDARRDSEAQYRALVDNATYGIYRATLDGHFLQVNPALAQMLAYASTAELMDKDLPHDVYRNSADRAAILEQYTRAGRVTGVEVEWKRKDGKFIFVRLSGRLVRDAEDHIREVEVIAEDVTDRRAADRQLRMAQKYEAIGQLAGGIAHDFNNVIGAIMGWAELGLEECPPEAPIRNRLEKIRDQADRAAALTKQLLAFARRQMLEPRVLNLNEIVTDVTSLLDKVIGKDIELKTVLDANLQTTRADSTQVEQVLMNLCLNARDAIHGEPGRTMPHGGSIVIETAHFEVDSDYATHYPYARLGHYVVLSVSDTGVGMDTKVLEHVFEPFFTTKQLGKGTGLGLATVYGIVKQHGGFINVYSELEHGSTFKVYFPVAGGTSQARKEPEAEESARGGSETILVAEDHPGISTMARELLERLGYRVLLAADGEEAVRIFTQEKDRIALALLDVVMPKLSGPEAYTRMCAIRPDLPVIFATGYSAESAPLLGAFAEKGVPILQKPYSPRILGRKIRDLLDRQKNL